MKMGLPIKLVLPESFFKAEVKCGYEVSAKQKRVWAVQLDLLKQLLDVCSAHNIPVQVFAGTLLGAVRHSGFIPWDDDVDVALTREGFEKLCAIAPTAFKEPYFFQTALTDRKCFISEARLRNSETMAVIRGQNVEGYNNGIYIDVFVLDGVAESKIKRSVQGVLKRFVRKILISYYMTWGRAESTVDSVFWALKPLWRLLGYERLYRLYHKILSLYTKNASRIGLVTHSSYFMNRYWVHKSEMMKTQHLKFEVLDVPVPVNWDVVLSRIYDDYMTYPPVEKRGVWHEGQIIFDPDVSFRGFTGSQIA